MSTIAPCAVCHATDAPTRAVEMFGTIQFRCDDCRYFGTSGPAPKPRKDKPRTGESLAGWLRRTGRCTCRADGVEPCRLHEGA